MKPIKKITVGSKVFFEGMSGYRPHDSDILCIMDEWKIEGTNILNMKLNGEDVFFTKNMSKEEFIQNAFEEHPMRIGKFMVPEFAEYIGFDVEDLKRLKPILDDIDDKHKYYVVIYNSYIKNKAFKLTEEQRQIAFDLYKKERGMS